MSCGVYSALLKSKKAADDLTVQSLGECHIAGIRRVELLQLVTRDLPSRSFPSRPLQTPAAHPRTRSAFLDRVDPSSLTQYDPFPQSRAAHDRQHDPDHEPDADEEGGDKSDNGYASVNERASEEEEEEEEERGEEGGGEAA